MSAVALAAQVDVGDYLTDGKLLVLVLHIIDEGAIVEEGRADEPNVFTIREDALVNWRPVEYEPLPIPYEWRLKPVA